MLRPQGELRECLVPHTSMKSFDLQVKNVSKSFGTPPHQHGVPELRPVPHLNVFNNIAFGLKSHKVP